MNEEKNPFKGNLTHSEWKELVTLDYVLTFGYTENFNADLKRQKQLRDKQSKQKQ